MSYYDDGYGNSFFPAIYITEDTVLKPSAIKDGPSSRYPVQLLFVMETQESKKSYAP